MKKIIFFCLLCANLSMTGCSSLKKSIIYGSMIGSLTGMVSGVMLSPNKESQGANAAIFGLIGASVSGLASYALYQDDPRNYQLNHMLEYRPVEAEVEVGTKGE